MNLLSLINPIWQICRHVLQIITFYHLSRWHVFLQILSSDSHLFGLSFFKCHVCDIIFELSLFLRTLFTVFYFLMVKDENFSRDTSNSPSFLNNIVICNPSPYGQRVKIEKDDSVHLLEKRWLSQISTLIFNVHLHSTCQPNNRENSPTLIVMLFWNSSFLILKV